MTKTPAQIFALMISSCKYTAGDFMCNVIAGQVDHGVITVEEQTAALTAIDMGMTEVYTKYADPDLVLCRNSHHLITDLPAFCSVLAESASSTSSWLECSEVSRKLSYKTLVKMYQDWDNRAEYLDKYMALCGRQPN